MGDHFECEDNWWDSCALDAGEVCFAWKSWQDSLSGFSYEHCQLIAAKREYKSHKLAILYLQLITTLVYRWFKILFLYTIRSRPEYLDPIGI